MLAAAGRRVVAAAAFQSFFLGRNRRSWTPHEPCTLGTLPSTLGERLTLAFKLRRLVVVPCASYSPELRGPWL